MIESDDKVSGLVAGRRWRRISSGKSATRWRLRWVNVTVVHVTGTSCYIATSNPLISSLTLDVTWRSGTLDSREFWNQTRSSPRPVSALRTICLLWVPALVFELYHRLLNTVVRVTSLFIGRCQIKNLHIHLTWPINFSTQKWWIDTMSCYFVNLWHNSEQFAVNKEEIITLFNPEWQ